MPRDYNLIEQIIGGVLGTILGTILGGFVYIIASLVLGVILNIITDNPLIITIELYRVKISCIFIGGIIGCILILKHYKHVFTLKEILLMMILLVVIKLALTM